MKPPLSCSSVSAWIAAGIESWRNPSVRLNSSTGNGAAAASSADASVAVSASIMT